MKDFSQKVFSGFASKIGLMSFVLLFISFTFASQASAAIVINEIYAGGGNANAPRTNDFVELYNNGTTNVDISGYSLQTSPATSVSGNFTVCNLPTTGDTVIEPGTYFLIQLASGGANGVALPTANATCPANLAVSGSKVVLVDNGTQLTVSTAAATIGCPVGTGIVDFVGSGNANCFEGAGAAPAQANTTSIQRSTIGVDSNNNNSDFVTGTPSPMAATAANPTVNLSVSSTAGSEAGTTVITVTATASAPVTGAQTVTLAVTGTNITAGDFTLSSTTITIAGGATTGTVTFTVTDDAIVEGTETATLTISNPSSGITLGTTTTQNITITDNDMAAALADLTISQSAPSTVSAGANFTYTLTVTNSGTASTTAADVDFTVPANVTFVSATPSTCATANLVGNVVQFRGCTVNANGGTETLSVTVTAPATAQTITSTGANVIVDPANTVAESNDLNNTAETIFTNVTTGAVPVDLTISQSAPASVTTGSNFNYTLTVSNAGTDSLTNVDVDFTIPANVTQSGIATGSCTSITTVAGVVQFRGCSVSGNGASVLTVTVTAPATAQTITSTGANVIVDPADTVVETSNANNTAADVTTNVTARTTAAMVNVGGRVTNAKGHGISGVTVVMTDGNGVKHYAVTNEAGNYRFEEIEVGQTLIIEVRAKRYSFRQPSQVISLTDEELTINFVGNSKRVF